MTGKLEKRNIKSSLSNSSTWIAFNVGHHQSSFQSIQSFLASSSWMVEKVFMDPPVKNSSKTLTKLTGLPKKREHLKHKSGYQHWGASKKWFMLVLGWRLSQALKTRSMSSRSSVRNYKFQSLQSFTSSSIMPQSLLKPWTIHLACTVSKLLI